MARGPILVTVRAEFWRLFGSARAWAVAAVGVASAVAVVMAVTVPVGLVDPRAYTPVVAAVVLATVAGGGATLATPDPLRWPAFVARVGALLGLAALLLSALLLVQLALMASVLESGVLATAAILWAALALPAAAIGAASGHAGRPWRAAVWVAGVLAIAWTSGRLSPWLSGPLADAARLGALPWRVQRASVGILDVGDLAWLGCVALGVCASAVVARRGALVLAPLLPAAFGPLIGADWPAHELLVMEPQLPARFTLTTLETLHRDVTVEAHPFEGAAAVPRNRRLASLLVELDRASPRVRTAWAAGTPGTVRVWSATRDITVAPDALVYPLDPIAAYVSFDAEAAIRQAIRQAGAGDPAPVVGFVTGHGEAAPGNGADTFGDLLRADGYAVRAVDLLAAGPAAVPADVGVLVILGPTAVWAPDEDAAVWTWLQGGGRALVATTRGGFVPDVVDRAGVSVSHREPPGPALVTFGAHPVAARAATRGSTVPGPDVPDLERTDPSRGVLHPILEIYGSTVIAAVPLATDGPTEARLVASGTAELAGDARMEPGGPLALLHVDAVRWLEGALSSPPAAARPRLLAPAPLTLRAGVGLLAMGGVLSLVFAFTGAWVGWRARVTTPA